MRMKSTFLWGVLFVVMVHGVSSELQLKQSSPVVKQPGETVKMSCVVSGDRMTRFLFHWIRQKPGRGLEWIGRINSGSSGSGYVLYGSSFQSRFILTEDVPSSTQFLQIQSLTVEESVVYYCAKWGGSFDYWGQGTQVLVSSGNPAVFPVIQCLPGTGDMLTVACLAHDFHPGSVFQWTDINGKPVDSLQYSPLENNHKYTGISVAKVSRRDWNSRKTFKCSLKQNETSQGEVGVKNTVPRTVKVNLVAVPSGNGQTLACVIHDMSPQELSVKWKKNSADLSKDAEMTQQGNGESFSAVSFLKVTKSDWDSQGAYTCEVTHEGKTYTEEISKDPVTVALNTSNPKEIHDNNQAEFVCVVTGETKSVVDGVTISWQVNGQPETGTTEPYGSGKISKLTKTSEQYKNVKRVKCSAVTSDNTSYTQEVTVNSGDGNKPEVKVYIGSEVSDDVTLVCLVFSQILQDHYIAWSENNGQSNGELKDGVTTPSQRIQNGYLVTSIYTTKKQNWNKNTFRCTAWTSTNNATQTVSKDLGNSIECP